MVANVMQELMDMKIWFLWRYATGKNGKITKVPFPLFAGHPRKLGANPVLGVDGDADQPMKPVAR